MFFHKNLSPVLFWPAPMYYNFSKIYFYRIKNQNFGQISIQVLPKKQNSWLKIKTLPKKNKILLKSGNFELCLDRAGSSFDPREFRAVPKSVKASFPRGSGWFSPGTPRLAGAHGFNPPFAPSPSAPFPFLAVEAHFSSLFFAPQPEDDKRVGESVLLSVFFTSKIYKKKFLYTSVQNRS